MTLNVQKCYTDTYTLERDRDISIKSMPMTFILQDTKSKSYSFNIINTPEHVYFVDEITAALQLYDIAISDINANDNPTKRSLNRKGLEAKSQYFLPVINLFLQKKKNGEKQKELKEKLTTKKNKKEAEATDIFFF
ncbi:P-loop containing nucleoside triphosphate hydrolase protein [Gigaspora margarita]|uniref:P-loop containing nucleoside triphosphate hydrolase protein n=1 Tax=Gigaspora margarita TaxID=4874 RepID=A0A8H4AB33_GIGMA|nr:P-loop containing nucleoside triphosphate hydrolase protein [Gigaspora margarita]